MTQDNNESQNKVRAVHMPIYLPLIGLCGVSVGAIGIFSLMVSIESHIAGSQITPLTGTFGVACSFIGGGLLFAFESIRQLYTARDKETKYITLNGGVPVPVTFLSEEDLEDMKRSEGESHE